MKLRSPLTLVVAGVLWLPCLHFVFRKSAGDFYRPSGLSPQAKQLAARHLALWTNEKSRDVEIAKMRVSNAEWDFMGRSFLVWSLSNMALREPASKPVSNSLIRSFWRKGLFNVWFNKNPA